MLYKQAFIAGMVQYIEKRAGDRWPWEIEGKAKDAIKAEAPNIFKQYMPQIKDELTGMLDTYTAKMKKDMMPYYGGLMAAPFISQLTMGGRNKGTTNVYKNYNSSTMQPMQPMGMQGNMSTSLGTPYNPYKYKNY